jgi:hypothetical protein
MDYYEPLASDTRGQVYDGGLALDLNDYYKSHKVRGRPRLGELELKDCTRLIDLPLSKVGW